MDLSLYPHQTQSPDEHLHLYGCSEHSMAVPIAYHYGALLLPEDIVEIHRRARAAKIIVDNDIPIDPEARADWARKNGRPCPDWWRCWIPDQASWEAYGVLAAGYVGHKAAVKRVAVVAPSDLPAALRAHPDTAFLQLNWATRISPAGKILSQHFTDGFPDFARGGVAEEYNPWPKLPVIRLLDYRLWVIMEE